MGKLLGLQLYFNMLIRLNVFVQNKNIGDAEQSQKKWFGHLSMIGRRSSGIKKWGSFRSSRLHMTPLSMESNTAG